MNEIPFCNKTFKLGIQTKLSILIVFTATLIFSGYFFYSHFTVKSAMKAELYDLSRFSAKQLEESLKTLVWDFNTASIKKIINSTMLEKQVYAVAVRDVEGGILSGMIRDSKWNIAETGQELSGCEYVGKEDILMENRKIGSVEVCVSDIFMRKKLTESVIRMLITIAILDAALISSLFIGVRKSIVLPLRRIVGSVRIIASGELDRAVPNNGRNDEIGHLASDVDKMRLAIKEMTENLKEQERLKSEMELAKKIQTVLLPKNPAISGYDIAASMEPAEEVGGDYYDVISVGGYDWIVLGDVSGHGVTAGLVMMMVQTSIHTVLIQNPEVPTSHLLSVVNRAIYENLVKMDESKHMTIVVIACGKNGFFDLSGLHDDILLWCAGTRKVERIKTDGMWIGLEPDISDILTADEFRMEIGDCIVLYTDGITEALSRDGKLFGEDRLTKIVESSGGKSAAEIHDAILDALKDYDKPDDVTLFVMKRTS